MSRNVYVIGSKGIPANYGGFETFVEKLTEYQKDSDIQYYVACMEENSLKSNITQKIFEYNGAKCFNIKVPNVGPAKAIIYDILALKTAIKISEENNDDNPIFYILACRIGPFISYFQRKIYKMNGQIFVNPDGHEWLREKWSLPVRKYWKLSEKLMIKHSNLVICDSMNIEKYILDEYEKYNPETKYIAYGTDLEVSKYCLDSEVVVKWFEDRSIEVNLYYLIVGRFVPENNFETMIREFIKSNSEKDLVIVTNFEGNSFYDKLKRETKFDSDPRIKFVGTVYDQELLKYIRENAFAYIHGHEVGGTNPSLLEALYSTKINLLLNVKFNSEVGGDSALYWDKDNLGEKIDLLENFSGNYDLLSGNLSKKRIEKFYTWTLIINKYESIFK